MDWSSLMLGMSIPIAAAIAATMVAPVAARPSRRSVGHPAPAGRTNPEEVLFKRSGSVPDIETGNEERAA